VRLRLVPSLSPLAALFHRVINRLRWGEHRGGMFVSVVGATAAGARIERSWHLLAEGDDGPLIPSMAAAAIIRRCLDGRLPPAGARPAVNELELADYAPLFSSRAIFAGMREVAPGDEQGPLYRRLLGEAWDTLPEPLRAIHGGGSDYEGIATVERGTGLIARLIGACFGFPRAGSGVPVRVTFVRHPGREVWWRDFAGRSLRSVQHDGAGRFDRLLVERFGPFAVGLALVLEEGKLRFVPRGWSFLGIPLPTALAPRCEAYECAEGGRFRFHVEIGHPLAGVIVRYRGWLAPAAAPLAWAERAAEMHRAGVPAS
jgi:hypothetical protein